MEFVIFTVEHGCFSYPKSKQRILEDISFQVSPGDFIGILGPNGVGKTTLLRCMMGFLKWSSGNSKIDGVEISTMDRRSLWKKLAYVPQARSAAHSMSVEEMVLLGRSSHFGLLRQPSKEDRDCADQAMERLGISHLAKRSCAQLSGGEMQMVLISRALAAGPDLLILDEPESNLDFKNQLIILDTLTQLTVEGVACIFNTHYPAHALQRAHKALLLDKVGHHIFGSVPQVITEKNIAAAFGVEAVIGEIETRHHIYRDVVPVQVMAMDMGQHEGSAFSEKGERGVETKIAIIGIIMEGKAYAEQINEILHRYSRYIIGRLGMPYEKKGLAIISVIVDAPEEEIEELSAKISLLPGTSTKTVYSKY